MFSVYKHGGQAYALILEFIKNHEYENSRFLRQVSDIEEDDDSESEPFESFEESLASAEKNWGETVGGFWRDIEEAEKHVEHLRAQGYGI